MSEIDSSGDLYPGIGEFYKAESDDIREEKDRFAREHGVEFSAVDLSDPRIAQNPALCVEAGILTGRIETLNKLADLVGFFVDIDCLPEVIPNDPNRQ